MANSNITLFMLLSAFVYCSKGQRPNIVLILADDLGWNDVSFHGSTQIPTPNIDQLVRDGIFLNNYYVSPICTPTRGALMTGRHPMSLGLQRSVILGSCPWGLGLNETIMPQYLKQLGYATHAVGKWHLGFFMKELTPLYRGFDSFYGYYLGAEDYVDHTAWATAGYWGFDYRDGLAVDHSANGSYSTELFATRAEKIIANHNTSQPLFLFLPTQAVHSGDPVDSGHNPLEAPKKYTDRFPHITDPNRKLFAGMVAALDDAIGNVTAALKARGMMENTVIIFSTDNGGPAAGFDMNHANNWPLRGVKATYWEGGMRATGFIWSPLLQKSGRVSNQLIHVSDWLPTIMHIAGGSPEFNKTELYGMNMWDVLSLDLPSPRHEIVHNYDKTSGALRQGDYKLILIGKEKSFTKQWPDWYKPESANVSALNLTIKCGVQDLSLPDCTEATSPCLYNIAQDPCEFNNIASKHPTIVGSMVGRLMEIARKSQAPRNCPVDKWSAPTYHGDVWVPWIKLPNLPPGVNDYRACDPVEADLVDDMLLRG
ncbi:arylsulfatase B-like [Watersipora subatra]|uniref:arylsulfatase B-like n=1 Tax=Watersipora subatra TaxID=2589382 RepID=UPI00355C5448